MNKQIFSRPWGLIKQDLIKVGKGFLIALAGAAIAFLGEVSGIIDYSAYGEAGPFIALAVSSVCSTVVNLIRKLINGSVYTN